MDEERVVLEGLEKGYATHAHHTGKNFLYSASVYNGRIYIVTNEDAPRYRVFVAEVGNMSATIGKKSFRRRVRFCRAWGVGRKTVCAVRAKCNFTTEDFQY